MTLLCASVEKLTEGVRKPLQGVVDGQQVARGEEADLDRAGLWGRHFGAIGRRENVSCQPWHRSRKKQMRAWVQKKSCAATVLVSGRENSRKREREQHLSGKIVVVPTSLLLASTSSSEPGPYISVVPINAVKCRDIERVFIFIFAF